MVQLSHPHTTRKTTGLSIQIFVSKVMSLLFNMLSRFVIAFLVRSKRLLLWWLQSLSTVILESKKIKSVTASTFPPSVCHEVMGLDAMILVFWVLSFKPAFSLFRHIYLLKPLFMLLSAPDCSDPSPCPRLGVEYEVVVRLKGIRSSTDTTLHFPSFFLWVFSHTVSIGNPTFHRQA